MYVALARPFLRCFYLFLGVGACCGAVLVLGTLGMWAVLGNEPARASRWMSDWVGQEVQIGGIDISWHGGGPKLHLSQVQIVDPETKQPLLSFKEAYLGTGLPRAQVKREWVPRHLIIAGGQLTVERRAAGCIRIHGLQSPEAPCADSSDFPAWLFKLSRLTLLDMKIEWFDPALELVPLQVHLTALHLFNKHARHRLKGVATLPESFGKTVAIQGEFAGNSFRDPESQGVLRLASEGLRLGYWQGRKLFSELYLADGVGNLELAIEWGKTAAPEVDTKFALKNVIVAGSMGRVLLPQISGTARYQWLKDGWSLEVPRLFVAGDKGPWPMAGMQLRFYCGPAPSLQGQFDLLQLQDLVALVQISNQVDPKLRLFLEETQPVGELHRLKFSLPLKKEAAADWKLSAVGAKFGLQPWRQWPGIEDLAFGVQLTGKGGQLTINGGGTRLLNASEENQVRLNTLRGKIVWWQGHKGWQLLSNNIYLENRDLSMAVALHFRDLSPAGIPHLDLILALERLELAALSQYLPFYAASSPLMGWLGQAFSAGRAVGGGVVFQGPWRSFPFPEQGGRLAMELGVREVTLSYAPGWPGLEAVDAYLYSDGQTLTARAIKGQVLNSQVVSAVARISDLKAETRSLSVKSQAQGDVESGQRFIQQSPLQKRYGGFLQEVKLRGDARLDLQLEMPLGKKKELPRVKGELAFANADLRQRHNPFLAFTAMGGNLHFTHAGIEAKGLLARFLGQPVAIDLKSQAENKDAAMVQASVHGFFSASALAEKGFSFLSPWLKGAANFTAEAAFQKGPTGGAKLTILQVNSDLKGMQITLPPPFAKPPGQAQKFSLEIRSTEAKKWQIRGAYKEWLESLFEIEESKQSLNLLRGKVQVGDHAVELPEHGVRIEGTLPELSASAWHKVFASRSLKSLGRRMPLAHISLRIGRLELWGQHFDAVAVEASQTSALWRVQVAAPAMRGGIVIPVARARGPVDITLEHLYWDSPPVRRGLTSLNNPQGWPPFQFQCRRCKYSGYDLGRVRAHISSHAHGVHLEQLEVVSPTIRLQGKGDWVVHGKTQWSHLDFKVDSPDFGQLLANLGHPTNLVGGKTEIQVVAGWPGSPSELDLKQVDGNIRLEMGKGRLLNVKPGAGRLLGLLSISALPRRLALDFSDIFSKGLAFDRLKGDFSLHQGNAFSNELVMKGPTARIQAQGRIGLADQDYEQIVAVTPNVFASLPLAGAMAGGPVGLGVGAALMLADKFADKMLGTPVGQLVTYYYEVSGSWTKPTVARLRKFPSSKP